MFHINRYVSKLKSYCNFKSLVILYKFRDYFSFVFSSPRLKLFAVISGHAKHL